MRHLAALVLLTSACTDDAIPPPADNDLACPTNLTLPTAVQIEIPTSWDPADHGSGIAGYAAGQGTTKFWLLQEVTFSGESTTVSAKVRACGTELPAVTKNVGYPGKIVMETPAAVFDRPELPTLSTAIELADLSADAAFTVPATWMVLGATMEDPSAAWPDWTTAANRSRLLDPDGDGFPGLVATPRTGTGYVRPLTTATATMNPDFGTTADRIGVALRAKLQLDGARERCTGAHGTAEILAYDAQVVSCHQLQDAPGVPCTAAQARFVDDHTPKFEFQRGTFELKIIDAATCDAARKAFE